MWTRRPVSMWRGWARGGVTCIPAGSTDLSTTTDTTIRSPTRETTGRSSSVTLSTTGILSMSRLASWHSKLPPLWSTPSSWCLTRWTHFTLGTKLSCSSKWTLTTSSHRMRQINYNFKFSNYRQFKFRIDRLFFSSGFDGTSSTSWWTHSSRHSRPWWSPTPRSSSARWIILLSYQLFLYIILRMRMPGALQDQCPCRRDFSPR